MIMLKRCLCLGALVGCSFVGLVLCIMLNGTATRSDDVNAQHNGNDAADLSAGNDDVIGTDVVTATDYERKLIRRKRYVAFPVGSSFSLALCITIGFVGNPLYSYISWSTNFGAAYDLPNQTWVREKNQFYRPNGGSLVRPVVMRRHRRDLYGRLESVIDNMGYAGKQCVLRALCESSQQYFASSSANRSNLAVEMVKTIFSLPRAKVLPFEHPDVGAYDAAHRRGRDANANCERLFDGCSFSLLDFALGQYMRSNSLFQ